MDKIEKFLAILNKKERAYILSFVFPKIQNLDLKGLDTKRVTGFPLWRVRVKNVRIIFLKNQKEGVILKMSFRKDAYKDL